MAKKENKSYLNNPLIKRANSQHEYTQEQVKEILKCSEDPIYFIKNYIKIVHLDRGLVNFEMYPFQEKIVKTIQDNRFVICKIPRQSGKTISMTSWIIHYILFNPNTRVAILANKRDTAKDILEKLKNSYENLPLWLQQGVLEWNKQSITLENGSKVIVSSTSGSAIRGGSYNCISGDSIVDIKLNNKLIKTKIENIPKILNNDMQIHQDLIEDFKPISNKYYSWYKNIIFNAKNRQIDKNEYYEEHHIHPLSLGGKNTKENKVLLTLREHYIVHKLLVKFLTGNSKRKMVFAWNMLSCTRKDKYIKISSRQYAEIKKLLSEQQKGKTLSEQAKQKISMANKGRGFGKKMPPEFGKKISLSLTGHKKNEDWVKKINNNPEKIRKTAEKHRGMKRSDESKLKMSLAKKGKPPNNKGMKWCYNIKTLEKKYCRELPDGFNWGMKPRE